MQIEELTAGIASVSSEVAKFDGIAAGLAALEKAHPKDIACEVTTTAGMKQAIAGRAAWREPRIAVEKARKAAKAPVLELGRAIDTFAKELETKLLAGESHYDGQIKAEEARKDQLRIEAAQRVLKLQAGIDAIKAIAAPFAALSSYRIAGAISAHESTPPTDYAEFQAEAEAAHAAALAQLRAFHAAATEREAEAARIKAEQDAEAARLKAEREELTRLRAEQEQPPAAPQMLPQPPSAPRPTASPVKLAPLSRPSWMPSPPNSAARKRRKPLTAVRLKSRSAPAALPLSRRKRPPSAGFTTPRSNCLTR